MIGIIKYIQIFFLFLAVSVLNAHMIIPHDHHQADSDLCSEIPGSASKTGTTHHQGLPGHCHAFNDLASEKKTTLLIKNQTTVHDLIPASVFEANVTKRQFSAIKILDSFDYKVIKGLPGLSSLRAPPTVI